MGASASETKMTSRVKRLKTAKTGRDQVQHGVTMRVIDETERGGQCCSLEEDSRDTHRSMTDHIYAPMSVSFPVPQGRMK